MKPLKNKIVQARMSEDELVDFEAVKDVLHAKTNSEAIRLMVKDEQTIETVAKRQNAEKETPLKNLKVLLHEDRLAMTKALMGITNPTDEDKLDKLLKKFADIQAQLAGLMWSLSNINNNANQVAKVMNTAAKTDPANSEAWTWTNSQLYKIGQQLDALSKQLYDIEVALHLRKKVGTIVSVGDTFNQA